MIRTTSIAALALAAFSAQAIAADAVTPAATDAAPAAVSAAVLANAAQQIEARQHLVRQGYVGISALEKDESGRWTGTALKDGKASIVSVDLRRPAAPMTN
jgi:hypothetical protein